MTRKELIKQCRYYNGEKENPFKEERQDKKMFWDYEKSWVELTLSSDAIIGKMLDGYRRYPGMKSFEVNDGTPETLKALLFNRYMHWMEDDGFKGFYRGQYVESQI